MPGDDRFHHILANVVQNAFRSYLPGAFDWYLVAAVDDKPRTFRVSSMLAVQTLDTRVRRPRGFDLARYWAESIARFERELYSGQPTVVAGVPPDQLGPLGQRWGNPLYRWDRMAGEGWAWWTARVKRMLHQADAFRIDHFRGFAACYEIAASSPDARSGRWVPGPGRPLFDAIGQALGELPIVAEDLGFITPDVHALRHALGYPGMKILQFAFSGDGEHPYLPQNFEPEVVVYTGTHDNDTVAGWWATATDYERNHARGYLATDGQDMAWTLIRAAMASVADTAVHPMQDVLALPTDSLSLIHISEPTRPY